ncbi:MAG: hypothetical protein V3V08_16965 [Nannocystaceae bacterium]
MDANSSSIVAWGTSATRGWWKHDIKTHVEAAGRQRGNLEIDATGIFGNPPRRRTAARRLLPDNDVRSDPANGGKQSVERLTQSLDAKPVILQAGGIAIPDDMELRVHELEI